MENFNGAIEKLVNSLEKEEMRDSQIIKIFHKLRDQPLGVQNKAVELLATRLRYYKTSDLKQMRKDNQPKSSSTLTDEDPAYLTIGNETMERFHIITLKNLKGYNDKPIMMVFHNQSYQRDLSELENFISNRIKEAGAPHKGTFVNVIHYIHKQTFFDFRKFNYDPNVMVFRNGVYNFEEEEFIQSPTPWNSYYFYELPHHLKMDKRYKCSKFKKTLVEWLDKKTEPGYRKGNRKILIRDIFEMMGLCMTMNMGMRTAFLNYGPPRCGKTQFFNIFTHIIGKDNMSNTSLQRLSKNEFGADDLPYKILNYCGDLPSAKVLDCGIFKSVSGGDTMVQIERKGKDKADFQAVCKFWSNANKVPRLGAWDDEATYDRFIMIAFLNQFNLLDEDTIQNFYQSIIGDSDEIQGIIHECIVAYYRLLKRNGFRQVLRADTMHIWNYMSNKIYATIYDGCIKSKKDKIEVNEFWDYYFEINGAGDSKNYITRRMEEMGYRKKESRKTGSKTKIWYYHGLKWNAKVLKEINLTKQDDLDNRLTDAKRELDDF